MQGDKVVAVVQEEWIHARSPVPPRSLTGNCIKLKKRMARSELSCGGNLKGGYYLAVQENCICSKEVAYVYMYTYIRALSRYAFTLNGYILRLQPKIYSTVYAVDNVWSE